jgi:hypothetical protein
MIEDIYQRIWNLSRRVDQPSAYAELVSLTQDLISLYDEQGRLSEDPFHPTRLRALSLPDNLGEIMDQRVCLVTGGSGCVGSTLIDCLLNYNIDKVVVLDTRSLPPQLLHPKIVFEQGDVRDYQYQCKGNIQRCSGL